MARQPDESAYGFSETVWTCCDSIIEPKPGNEDDFLLFFSYCSQEDSEVTSPDTIERKSKWAEVRKLRRLETEIHCKGISLSLCARAKCNSLF